MPFTFWWKSIGNYWYSFQRSGTRNRAEYRLDSSRLFFFLHFLRIVDSGASTQNSVGKPKKNQFVNHYEYHLKKWWSDVERIVTKPLSNCCGEIWKAHWKFIELCSRAEVWKCLGKKKMERCPKPPWKPNRHYSSCCRLAQNPCAILVRPQREPVRGQFCNELARACANELCWDFACFCLRDAKQSLDWVFKWFKLVTRQLWDVFDCFWACAKLARTQALNEACKKLARVWSRSTFPGIVSTKY